MGYSNGGAFSYTLALQTDKFAAIASLSSSFFEGRTVPSETAKLSVLQIHGEDDIVVPYDGGQNFNLPIVFESAMFTVTQWANHNGLFNNLIIETPEENIIVYSFSVENNPYEVKLYCLEGINHNLSFHPFVSSLRCYVEVWEFFEDHPKQD
ncbi:MAG: hypothetical protein HQ541_03145 [Mariniphaga sp.]|nr:hypothetical protein [Mariniphaga sp.]